MPRLLASYSAVEYIRSCFYGGRRGCCWLTVSVESPRTRLEARRVDRGAGLPLRLVVPQPRLLCWAVLPATRLPGLWNALEWHNLDCSPADILHSKTAFLRALPHLLPLPS